MRAGLLLAATLLVACGGGPISIGGRVVDQRQTPITKAEVFTKPETDVVVTNRRGFFILNKRINEVGETEPIRPGVYQIHVRKFGFEDLAFEVTVEGGKTRVADLIMQPRTPDIGETAPDVLKERETEPDEGSVPTQGI